MRTLAPLLLASLIALGLAIAAGADEALTTADVVRFLQAGISERTILTELQQRGFGEPLDAAAESRLRAAGASETLMVAVRRFAAAAPLAPSPAGPSAAAPAARAPAQPAPAPPRRGPTFGASTRSVRVPVSVLDKRGQPVLGLQRADFELSEDGRPQEVTFFSGERKPLRIALALDTSGSMRDKMRQVADALGYFIGLLEPEDEIMVITFSDRVHIDQDFTSDRELLERVFMRLQPDGGTALFDATIEAIRRVASAPAESKAVVLVTDGVDTQSRATFSELREEARRSEVPVFSIGIDSDGGSMLRSRTPRWPIGGGGGGGPLRPRWPGTGGRGGWPGGGGGGTPRWPGNPGGGGSRAGDFDFDARPLLDLAEDTGARAEILKTFEHDRDGHLKSAVESIAVTLRHRYLVGYEPEGARPGWRKIRVDVDRPSVKVHARKGYYTEG